jgi:hypothetical protein
VQSVRLSKGRSHPWHSPPIPPDLPAGAPSPGSRLKGRGRFRRLGAWTLLRACRARIRTLERQNDQQSLILRINNLLAGQLEPERLFEAMSRALWQEIRHDFMSLSLLEPGGEFERSHLLHTPTGWKPRRIRCGAPWRPCLRARRCARGRWTSWDPNASSPSTLP